MRSRTPRLHTFSLGWRARHTEILRLIAGDLMTETSKDGYGTTLIRLRRIYVIICASINPEITQTRSQSLTRLTECCPG